MKVLILLVVVSSTLAQDCWWSGCQPNDWAVTGCGYLGMDEGGKQACVDGRGVAGNKYNCCPKGAAGSGSINPPPPPATEPQQPEPEQGQESENEIPGSATGDLTYEEFAKAVTSAGYPKPSQETFKNFKNNAAKVGKISTKQEQAMALAQFLWESDGLRAKKEYACKDTGCPGEYRVPGCDAPGQDYYGRGYIQLTWCYNYKKASEDIFGDDRLVRNPELVATDDDTAWKTAFWYWANAVHDAPGVQQGKFGATTKAINGALECSWAGNPKPQKRFDIYSKVRVAFGLPGDGDSSGCA